MLSAGTRLGSFEIGPLLGVGGTGEGTTPGWVSLIDPTVAGPARHLLQLPPATLVRGLAWTPESRGGRDT